jgi:hypothetical protein
VARFVSLLACALFAARAVPVPRDVPLGESFRLGVGETARVAGEALVVGFETVAEDSRCPKGEQCAREGDARVRVWVQKAEEPRVALELHTSARGPAVAAAYGFAVRLLRLEPYPVTGRTIDLERYRATLEVERGEAGSSEGP